MKRAIALFGIVAATSLCVPQGASAQGLLGLLAGREEASRTQERPLVVAQLRGPQAAQNPAPGRPGRGGAETPPASQPPPPPPPPARRISLPQAEAAIRRTTPGRSVDAKEETGRDGRPVYRVRWQADSGERIDFIVDAQTGAVSRSGG